jgi:hypothetical protein
MTPDDDGGTAKAPRADMQDLTERFTQALEVLHTGRTGDALVELFREDATLSKLGDTHEARGPDGARDFWDRYRATFDDVEATFSHVVVGDGVAALEWTSTGTLPDGEAFSYAGVSVLDGSDDDTPLLTGFRTYYDSAAFLERPVVPDTHEETAHE